MNDDNNNNDYNYNNDVDDTIFDKVDNKLTPKR